MAEKQKQRKHNHSAKIYAVHLFGWTAFCFVNTAIQWRSEPIYQQFDILRHDFQQFDTLWAVAQPCKLHTMGIGEQKERCKAVFTKNPVSVF